MFCCYLVTYTAILSGFCGIPLLTFVFSKVFLGAEEFPLDLELFC